MTVRLNLWSLTLVPGEPVPLYVRRDFQITNAALAEELRSTDGRSVVKVTHHPIPPSAFESDSEFDSDEEFDEDEDMEDSEESGEDKPEVAEEGDDEDEDDEDEESDFSDDEDIEETSVLCSLTAGKWEQAVLNLTFVEGEVVIFEVSGPNAVHLMGNYVNQWPEDEDSECDDSECDSHDDYSDLDFDEDEFDLEEMSELEEAPKGKIVAIEEKKPSKKAAAVKAAEPVKTNKRKAEEEPEASPAKPLTKAEKKQLAKKAKTADAAAPAPAAATPAPKKEEQPKKRTLPSGLVIEDIKAGTGPVAKSGKRLGMRYVGKLTNGKQFDANTGGKPFSFVLGRGEVIRGWDEGLAGMAVGGERRLTIPAKLAYGNQKIPGIPANSTLKFDVKLVSIN